MIWPAKVSRSTMAAHSRGSVKVLVQPENGSLLAMAMAMAMAERSMQVRNGARDKGEHPDAPDRPSDPPIRPRGHSPP
jgi:hypothetical protein